MKKTSKIYVAGHNGLAGSALLRKLVSEGYQNVLSRSSKEFDLRDQRAVNQFFENEKPEYVFFAAGKVGGIFANMKYPADFIFDNVTMIFNTVKASYLNGVKKLLYLGSSCIYPKLVPQPIKEEFLLTGPLEESSRPYAIAKIAGVELCQSFNKQYNTNYLCLMPTNMFGLNDNYDLNNSHLIPALIRKIYEAKLKNKEKLILWGTGTPRREIICSDDFAEACLYLMMNFDGGEIINIGTGIDYTIKDFAIMIADIIGYNGSIIFDSTKPDGSPQKLLDVTHATQLGWRSKGVSQNQIKNTINDFIVNYHKYTNQ